MSVQHKTAMVVEDDEPHFAELPHTLFWWDGNVNSLTTSILDLGRSFHDRIIAAALAREERLLSTLSPEEIETLIVCLRKMRANVPYVNAYDPTSPTQGKRKK